jgi:aspartyl/asparaginyl beta-hydroxylase (cupin superfamily)
MKLNVPYKVLCDFDSQIIESIKERLEEKDWHVNDTRNTMDNLEQTQSIILRYFDDYSKVNFSDSNWKKNVINHELYEKYSDLIEQSLKHISDNTDIKFKEYICFFARLRPNGKVGQHIDSGNFLETCHRIHIPIITHPDCKYIIEDIEYHWEPGNVYEFDNTRRHGVENRNDQWRVHLMFNLYE